MKDEIKEFEEFRIDEDGTYFYYIDKDGNEQWSYKLDNLKDYITNLEKENKEQLDENYKLSEWLVKKQKRIEELEKENEISKQIIKTLKVYLTKIKETSTLQEQVMAKYVLKYIEDLENVKKVLTGGDK